MLYHKHRIGFLLVAIAFTMFLSFGCSDGGGDSKDEAPNPEPNSNPTAVITSPLDDVVYDEGDYITFAGVCNDNEEGPLTGNSVVWTSSKDGHINYGTSFTENDLSAGTHVITLVTTDNEGASASDSVTIAVNPEGNTIPTAEITNPSDQDEFDEGANITFTGTGDDVEDGTLTGDDLVWRSSIDGVFGTGASVTVNDLSVETHTITLTATDGDNVFGTDSISISVSSSGGGDNDTSTLPSTLVWDNGSWDDKNWQ